MNVQLHIERLVLDGFAITPTERARFVDATQSELMRLFSSQGVSGEVAAGYSSPMIDGGRIPAIATPFDPISFGNQVARAVYRGLGGLPE